MYVYLQGQNYHVIAGLCVCVCIYQNLAHHPNFTLIAEIV